MVDKIRAILAKRAAATPEPQKIYYGDLAEELGLGSESARNPAMLRDLGRVSEDSFCSHGFMLSALVVNRDTGLPGDAFYPLAERLTKSSIPTSQWQQFVDDQLRAIGQHFRSRSNG